VESEQLDDSDFSEEEEYNLSDDDSEYGVNKGSKKKKRNKKSGRGRPLNSA